MKLGSFPDPPIVSDLVTVLVQGVEILEESLHGGILNKKCSIRFKLDFYNGHQKIRFAKFPLK
jgi:hypothetical protein